MTTLLAGIVVFAAFGAVMAGLVLLTRRQRGRYAETGHPETDRGRGDRGVRSVPTGLPGVATAGPACTATVRVESWFTAA